MQLDALRIMLKGMDAQACFINWHKQQKCGWKPCTINILRNHLKPVSEMSSPLEHLTASSGIETIINTMISRLGHCLSVKSGHTKLTRSCSRRSLTSARSTIVQSCWLGTRDPRTASKGETESVRRPGAIQINVVETNNGRTLF